MIDINVAMDKLKNFETEAELADYFRSCGIKAQKGESNACAIAVWLQDVTDEVWNVYTYGVSQEHIVNSDNPSRLVVEIENSPAMEAFIDNFDAGEYPDLEYMCDCDDCNPY